MTNSSNQSNILSKLNSDFLFTNGNPVTITSFSINNNILSLTLSGDPGSEARLSLIGLFDDLEDNITNSNGIEIVVTTAFQETVMKMEEELIVTRIRRLRLFLLRTVAAIHIMERFMLLQFEVHQGMAMEIPMMLLAIQAIGV